MPTACFVWSGTPMAAQNASNAFRATRPSKVFVGCVKINCPSLAQGILLRHVDDVPFCYPSKDARMIFPAYSHQPHLGSRLFSAYYRNDFVYCRCESL